MEKISKLYLLPDDNLLGIFKNCDLQSLGRLSCTCKRFNALINTYQSIWLPSSEAAIGSNMNSQIMIDRSKPYLTPKERCWVSSKWREGKNEKRAVLKFAGETLRKTVYKEGERGLKKMYVSHIHRSEVPRPWCLPWMCMEKECMIVSQGKKLLKLFRGPDGNVKNSKLVTPTPHSDDVSKCVINGDEVFTVGWDGKFCRFRKADLLCTHCEILHPREILSIDSQREVIITGSKDKTIKLSRAVIGDDSLCQVKEYFVNTRVLSLCLLPSNQFFIAGLPGTRDIHPLPIFDVNRDVSIGHLGSYFKPGGGVIGLYPESEQTVLTCGYDTTLKMWDLRTPKNYGNYAAFSYLKWNKT